MFLLYRLVDVAFSVYFWMILIRIIATWFPISLSGPLGKIMESIYEITEPYLSFFRRFLPPLIMGGAGIDFSPIIAILILQFIQRIVLSLLSSIIF